MDWFLEIPKTVAMVETNASETRGLSFRLALALQDASDFLYRHQKACGFMDYEMESLTQDVIPLELLVIPSHINLYCGKRIGRCVVGSVEKRLLQDPKASTNAGFVNSVFV